MLARKHRPNASLVKEGNRKRHYLFRKGTTSSASAHTLISPGAVRIHENHMAAPAAMTHTIDPRLFRRAWPCHPTGLGTVCHFVCCEIDRQDGGGDGTLDRSLTVAALIGGRL